MRLFRRVRYLLWHRQETRELREEMELHRSMAENEARAEGIPEQEVRAAARRAMGNTTLACEDARRVWLAPWIESVGQDLRYAARSLWGRPGFTFMALLALVLGIGLNTSLFTAINAVWTRPWDVPEPDRVVKMYPVTARGPVSGFALTAARFLNENSKTIEGAFAYRSVRAQLDGETSGAGVNTALVSGNFFQVLRVGMLAGRPFTLRDDNAGAPVAVAVISSALWSSRYTSRVDIVGSTIRIEGVPFTVAGVAPETFGGITQNRTDVWVPMASLRLIRANAPSAVSLLTDPGRCCSEVGARLRPGVSRGQAQAELNALFQQYLAEVNRVPTTEFFISRMPADILLTGTAALDSPALRQRAVPILAVALGAFAAVLLLACANVSNLLLARASARHREIAVRTAIGAGRGRVIRQLLTESLLLAGCASAGGLLLAYVLPPLVLRFMGQDGPTNLNLEPDWNVLSYAVLVGIGSATAFGLAPALRATRANVNDTMKRKSVHARPRVPLRGVLLGLQVAISVALLMAAGLLVRAVDRARTADPSFRTEGVDAVRVTLPANVYDIAREGAFYRDLMNRLESSGQPVAVSMLLPLGNRWENTGFGVECNTDRIVTQRVTRGYFDVLEIPFLAGGTFPARDGGRGTMVVDESLARACWPGREAVGQRLNMRGVPFEVVGVVRDAQLREVGMAQPTYFAPFEPDGGLVQGPAFVLTPSALTTAAAATVREMDPEAATDVIPLSEQRNRSLGETAGVARLASALGLLALMLATVGVYGVISYSVEQRRREIGVRVALGARPRQVVWLVLRRNAGAVLVGLIVGLAIAAGESVVLRSQLHGLSPTDPRVYVGVLGLLSLAGAAASVIPARRAARTDAVAVLHQE